MTKDEMLRFEPPSSKLLGREVVEIDTGKGGSVVRYAARPEFLNRHGTVQGGLLGAMLDSATALALYAVLPPEQTAVTTNLDIAFLKPAKPPSRPSAARSRRLSWPTRRRPAWRRAS